MTQSLNQRFSYSNPPHWACSDVIDWQVYDDGERIPVSQLVRTANQQEAHIANLLAEIQRLTELMTDTAPAGPPIDPSSTQLSLSQN